MRLQLGKTLTAGETCSSSATPAEGVFQKASFLHRTGLLHAVHWEEGDLCKGRAVPEGFHGGRAQVSAVTWNGRELPMAW